ncbi:MAG: hypothetical protein AB7C91_12835, partial [Sphaerochaeta sp.]
MEIDSLIAKSKISNGHNICPIEVKSSKNYTLNSLHTFKAKYAQQLHTSYVLHTSDLKIENDIVYLPIYMTPCSLVAFVSNAGKLQTFFDSGCSSAEEAQRSHKAIHCASGR